MHLPRHGNSITVGNSPHQLRSADETPTVTTASDRWEAHQLSMYGKVPSPIICMPSRSFFS
jgi:hypothetical protein